MTNFDKLAESITLLSPSLKRIETWTARPIPVDESMPLFSGEPTEADIKQADNEYAHLSPADRVVSDAFSVHAAEVSARNRQIVAGRIREDRGNPYHLGPGPGGGQFTSGPGGGGGILPGSDMAMVAATLKSGGTSHCLPEQLPMLMSQLKDSGDPTQLANLHVDGADKGNLFDYHSTDLPRDAMPVIPSHSANAQQFADMLQSQGITSHFEDVSPSDLHATQAELDGTKVAQIESTIEQNPDDLVGRTLVISQDDDVLDGHHRWAAAAVYDVAHPEANFRVNVLKCDTNIHTLLNLGQQFDDQQGIAHQAFGHFKEAAMREGERPPCPDPNRPYVWLDGKWVLLMTDDDDGVPQSLSYLPQTQHANRTLNSESDIRMREFNPNHDARGRFTSGGGGDSIPPTSDLTMIGATPTVISPKQFVEGPFHDAMTQMDRGGYLKPRDFGDYRETVVEYGGKVGGALVEHPDIQTTDGRTAVEISSVFNNGGPHGSAGDVLDKLIADGGNWGHCVGDGLLSYYEAHGFQAVGSTQIDTTNRPGWDVDKYGSAQPFYTIEVPLR